MAIVIYSVIGKMVGKLAVRAACPGNLCADTRYSPYSQQKGLCEGFTGAIAHKALLGMGIGTTEWRIGTTGWQLRAEYVAAGTPN